MRTSLLALSALLLSSTAFADDVTSAEIFSASINVTCTTPELKITFRPRAPRIGETVAIFDGIVSAKVDAKIINIKTGKVLHSLVLDDNTDPHESSWPVYQSEALSFYSQDAGEPTRLSYKGKGLEQSAKCRFR